MTKRGEVLKWFQEHIHDETDECVLWPYALDKCGYARMSIDGVIVVVSTFVCELVYGPRLGKNYDAAHGPCNNRACINYRHVSWKTTSANIRDSFYRDKTSNQSGINNGNYKHGNYVRSLGR
jgi:hypothetical protein